jgi:hypothetical protein
MISRRFTSRQNHAKQQRNEGFMAGALRRFFGRSLKNLI